jgi:hypothetical protein
MDAPQPLLHLIHGALPRVVESKELVVLGESPRVNRRKGVLATGRQVKIPSIKQQRIAYGFRIQPPPLCARPQRVVRIHRGSTLLANCHVRESSNRRCMALIDQPLSTNRCAR